MKPPYYRCPGCGLAIEAYRVEFPFGLRDPSGEPGVKGTATWTPELRCQNDGMALEYVGAIEHASRAR